MGLNNVLITTLSNQIDELSRTLDVFDEKLGDISAAIMSLRETKMIYQSQHDSIAKLIADLKERQQELLDASILAHMGGGADQQDGIDFDQLDDEPECAGRSVCHAQSFQKPVEAT